MPPSTEEVLAIALFIGWRREQLENRIDIESELEYWLHLNPIQRATWMQTARDLRKGLELYASKHR